MDGWMDGWMVGWSVGRLLVVVCLSWGRVLLDHGLIARATYTAIPLFSSKSSVRDKRPKHNDTQTKPCCKSLPTALEAPPWQREHLGFEFMTNRSLHQPMVVVGTRLMGRPFTVTTHWTQSTSTFTIPYGVDQSGEHKWAAIEPWAPNFKRLVDSTTSTMRCFCPEVKQISQGGNRQCFGKTVCTL